MFRIYRSADRELMREPPACPPPPPPHTHTPAPLQMQARYAVPARKLKLAPFITDAGDQFPAGHTLGVLPHYIHA